MSSYQSWLHVNNSFIESHQVVTDNLNSTQLGERLNCRCDLQDL